MSALKIALAGCGKMGGGMLRGWLKAGLYEVDVFDPQPLPEEFKGINHHKSLSDFSSVAPHIGMLVLAVKPQIMADVCQSLAPNLPEDLPVLSIAAGQSISSFQERFSAAQPVIRAMPNTPASIGKGITVACASASVTPGQKHMAETLLATVGEVLWTAEEKDMDAVTAVSGSGPAYVFYFIEALAKAGEAAGLEAEFAMKLARQTVIGSAALADFESTTTARTLRENVTSPGGTTQAALEILMAGDFQNILNEAVRAATKRSEALSG